MNIIAIIPARMGSSRFPGKPLAPLHGVPMLGHVYHRTKRNATLSGVHIATCDDEIRAYARSIGAECVMTSREHTRASDRTAEAADFIERRSGRIDAVVMVQGDEPMLAPLMIDEALGPLIGDATLQVVNLMAPIGPDEAADPNEVKVAVAAELLPGAAQCQQQRGRRGARAREHHTGLAGGAGAARTKARRGLTD